MPSQQKSMQTGWRKIRRALFIVAMIGLRLVPFFIIAAIVGLIFATIPTLITLAVLAASAFTIAVCIKIVPKIKDFFVKLLSKKNQTPKEEPAKKERAAAHKWTQAEIEVVQKQIAVAEKDDSTLRLELLDALARDNASLKAAKVDPALEYSFEALKQILQAKTDPVPVALNSRLARAIALLRLDVTSIAEWKAAFKQAGFGLQAELEAAIAFQEQKKEVFVAQASERDPIQPLGGFTRNEVYILDQKLVVKPIADKQALKHELAAREMSEILGLPTLKTTVGHLVAAEPVESVFEPLTAVDPEKPEKDGRAVFQKTQQYTQRKIKRQIKPNGHTSDVVLVQEFVQESATASDHFARIQTGPLRAYQAALQTKVSQMAQGELGLIKQAEILEISSMDLVAMQDLPLTFDSELDWEGQQSLRALRQIDKTSYQLSVIKAFVLGDLDNNFGNILLVKRHGHNCYDVSLIDFEEIMPESNISRNRPLPIAVRGKQNVQTGVICDLQYEYKTLEGVVAFSSALLALPQAKQPFSRDTLVRLLACLDVDAISRYHRATSEKNGFNAKQVAAQIERIEYLRAQCQAQLEQDVITLTPRQIYNHFYAQNPAYQKAQDSFATDFITYQLIGRISQDFASQEEKTNSKSRQLLHTSMQKTIRIAEAAQKNPRANKELDISISRGVLSDPKAAEIIVGFEILQQQGLENVLSHCKQLDEFLGSKPKTR